ncbi:ABC transporter permease subunit, partial [Pseudoalteromonas sp. SIMBA_148]
VGCDPLLVLFSVTMPLALPCILTCFLLAFARLLSEFGVTITFAANIPGETRTLPLALYTLIQTPGQEGAAARLCAIAVVIAMLSLLAS